MGCWERLCCTAYLYLHHLPIWWDQISPHRHKYRLLRSHNPDGFEFHLDLYLTKNARSQDVWLNTCSCSSSGRRHRRQASPFIPLQRQPSRNFRYRTWSPRKQRKGLKCIRACSKSRDCLPRKTTSNIRQKGLPSRQRTFQKCREKLHTRIKGKHLLTQVHSLSAFAELLVLSLLKDYVAFNVV